MLSKLFLAIYTCVVCGEEYELQNCFLPHIYAPCDECGDRMKFKAQKMIHLDWEWDTEE